MKYRCANCGQEFLTHIESQEIPCPVCGSTTQALPEIQYASFWRRAAAFTIDLILWAIIIIVVPLPFELVADAFPAAILQLLLIILMLVSPFVVFVIPLRLWKGQTLGKKLLGIVVTNENGGDVSWGQSVARLLLYFVSYAAIFLGFLWCIWDSRKRCFHDMIAHTVVVRAGEQAAMASEAKSREAVLQSVLAERTTRPLQEAPPPLVSIPRPQGEIHPAIALSFPVKWQRTLGTTFARRKGAVELHQDRIVFAVWVPRLSWIILTVALGTVVVMLAPAGTQTTWEEWLTGLCSWLLLAVVGVVPLLYYVFAEQQIFGISYAKIHKIQINSQQGTISFWMNDPDPMHQTKEVCWTARPDALIRLVTALKDKLGPATFTSAA